MSRLIDVDMLIKKLDGYTRTNNVEFNIACKYIIEVVKEQPTAFNVDKVVEQLESLEPFHVDGYGDVMVNCDDVIEIVKRS